LPFRLNGEVDISIVNDRQSRIGVCPSWFKINPVLNAALTAD